MDAIIKLLEKVYLYLTNYRSYYENVPVTIIEATTSRDDLGIQVDVLEPVRAIVFGNNTMTFFYGNQDLYGKISVPSAPELIEQLLTKKINEKIITQEKERPNDIADVPDSPYNLSASEQNELREVLGLRRLLLPHRPKKLQKVTQTAPKKINPVAPINPVRSIIPKV